jgi:hypothetical protein
LELFKSVEFEDLNKITLAFYDTVGNGRLRHIPAEHNRCQLELHQLPAWGLVGFPSRVISLIFDPDSRRDVFQLEIVKSF